MISAKEVPGYTPLAWASRNGHEEVVKILIRREEVNPDKSDAGGTTPHSHAVGSEEVFQFPYRGCLYTG